MVSETLWSLSEKMKNVSKILIAIFLTFSASQSLADDMVIEHSKTDIYGLVDEFVAAPVINRDVVERLTGLKLQLKESGVFDYYEGRNLRIINNTVELVDYREPIPGKGATRGAHLSFTLGNGCIARSEILAHYKDLVMSDSPRGRSLDEQTYYSRNERWGRVSFGFSERSPDCLKTVVISISFPGGK